ncbi:MAG: universal stress protein [Chloroflexi bacterium]|nr:universal stress protein [Chloroflexota bacterium]
MTPKKRLSILLADDGSQHAQAAVDLLGELSLPPKSRVTDLRVFTPDQIPGIPDFENALGKTKEQLLQMGIATETNLVLGEPAEKIIEIAETDQPDLIVIGAKGLRSTLGILLGGVAQQVVEYACCPVLIVRAPFRGLRRILIVTDGSSSARQAAHYLARFPLPKNADVRVMHVMPPEQHPIMMTSLGGVWQTAYIEQAIVDEAAAVLEKQKRKGEALLKRTCDLLQRNGIAATSVLERGDAATEIIEYVKANNVDLIVAGSRGLSQFKGWWMGSVSRKLIHYSNCSVLIVKAPGKE